MAKENQSGSARVFFALRPDKAGLDMLAAWQKPLRKLCGGRAMRTGTLHNTLVFLGNVAVYRLEALKLAAQEVAITEFELKFDEAHYWKHNRIVYAAPAIVPPQLTELVGVLEHQLHQHRFHFDRRKYRPHVTLLRNAKWNDAPLPAMPEFVWPAREFVLVQSLSDEHGARYRTLSRFPLQTS